MLLKILVFALLSLGCGVSCSHCDDLNRHFSGHSTIFIQCVLKYNEIAIYCLNCAKEYSLFLVSYNNLTNGQEILENHTTIDCRKRFIDNNQLDVVENVYVNTKHLWDSGLCSDCYAAGCDFTNGTETCVPSNRTANFIRLYDSTKLCINRALIDQQDVCKNCSTEYGELNAKYNEIRSKTADKFCFALKDMMNKTRIHWSKDLHCCEDRKHSKEDFLVLSGSSVFLSVIFYVAIYLFGLRKERIQYVPDDLMPPQSEDQNQSDGTIMNINSEEASTSETPIVTEPEIQKIINASEDSSSSDDEPVLPIENPNLIQI